MVDTGLRVVGVVAEILGVQMKREGQPGTEATLRELRYAVVEAEGARRFVSSAVETEPPPELNEIATEAGVTGHAEVENVALSVLVPTPLKLVAND